MRDYNRRIKKLIAEIAVLNQQEEYIRLKYMSLIIYKMRLIRAYQSLIKAERFENEMEDVK